MMETEKIPDGQVMVQQHMIRTSPLQTMVTQKKAMLLLDGVKIEMQRQPLIHQVRQLHGREPINCSCMQSGKVKLSPSLKVLSLSLIPPPFPL